MKNQPVLALDKPTLFTALAIAILYSFIALSCFSLLLQSARGGVATNSQGFYVITNPAPTVTLAWNKSTDATVVGYNLFYGVASRSYTNLINVGTATNIQVVLPARGITFFFAVTAYTPTGLESDYSSEVNYTPKALPPPLTMAPPVTLVVQKSQQVTGPFADTEMAWSIDPSTAPNDFFKLRIVAASDPPRTATASPLIKPLSVKSPPVPGE